MLIKKKIFILIYNCYYDTAGEIIEELRNFFSKEKGTPKWKLASPEFKGKLVP